MTRCWVIDTSPLILLSKIGQVELLHELSDEMVIPAGVAQEILQGAKNDVARRWLEHQGKNWVQDIGKIHSTISVWGLGLGESEVFSYIKTHPNYIAIIDDRAARNCACTLKIKVRGTLGVLLLAKKMGKITQLKPLLIKLQNVGLRINSRLINEALKLSGEQD